MPYCRTHNILSSQIILTPGYPAMVQSFNTGSPTADGPWLARAIVLAGRPQRWSSEKESHTHLRGGVSTCSADSWEFDSIL